MNKGKRNVNGQTTKCFLCFINIGNWILTFNHHYTNLGNGWINSSNWLTHCHSPGNLLSMSSKPTVASLRANLNISNHQMLFLSYLETLPKSCFDSLFKDPLNAYMIYKFLPQISQIFVLRILYLPFHVIFSDVRQWNQIKYKRYAW